MSPSRREAHKGFKLLLIQGGKSATPTVRRKPKPTKSLSSDCLPAELVAMEATELMGVGLLAARCANRLSELSRGVLSFERPDVTDLQKDAFRVLRHTHRSTGELLAKLGQKPLRTRRQVQ